MAPQPAEYQGCEGRQHETDECLHEVHQKGTYSKATLEDYVLLNLSTDFIPFSFNMDFVIFCT